MPHTTVGGFAAQDVHLMLDPDPAEVLAKLDFDVEVPMELSSGGSVLIESSSGLEGGFFTLH